MVILVLLLSGVGRKWSISEGVNYNAAFVKEGWATCLLFCLFIYFICLFYFIVLRTLNMRCTPLNCDVYREAPLTLRAGSYNRHLELTHLA